MAGLASARMEQMGNCPQIFSSFNYAALPEVDTGQGPGTFLAFIFGGGRNNSSGGGVIYLVGKIFGQVGLGWVLGWAGWAGLGAGGNIE